MSNKNKDSWDEIQASLVTFFKLFIAIIICIVLAQAASNFILKLWN